MTPAASTAAARGAARTLPPLRPRRVSGPVRPARPAPRRRTATTAPAPAAQLLGRLLARAAALPDARLLDRLIRGRAWIGLVAAMLIGLVFLQVSLLRLNTGIGRDVQQAATLERANQELRNRVSTLGSDERIHDAAAKLGMVMPAAGAVHYLDASHGNATRAARGVVAPDPVVQQPAVQAQATGAAQTAAAPAAEATAAPASGQATATTATAAATTTAEATPPPATTAAQTAAQPTAEPAATAAQPAASPPPAGDQTGGATPTP